MRNYRARVAGRVSSTLEESINFIVICFITLPLLCARSNTLICWLFYPSLVYIIMISAGKSDAKNLESWIKLLTISRPRINDTAKKVWENIGSLQMSFKCNSAHCCTLGKFSQKKFLTHHTSVRWTPMRIYWWKFELLSSGMSTLNAAHSMNF